MRPAMAVRIPIPPHAPVYTSSPCATLEDVPKYVRSFDLVTKHTVSTQSYTVDRLNNMIYSRLALPSFSGRLVSTLEKYIPFATNHWPSVGA